jgi:hypothetical protein
VRFAGQADDDIGEARGDACAVVGARVVDDDELPARARQVAAGERGQRAGEHAGPVVHGYDDGQVWVREHRTGLRHRTRRRDTAPVERAAAPQLVHPLVVGNAAPTGAVIQQRDDIASRRGHSEATQVREVGLGGSPDEPRLGKGFGEFHEPGRRIGAGDDEFHPVADAVRRHRREVGQKPLALAG